MKPRSSSWIQTNYSPTRSLTNFTTELTTVLQSRKPTWSQYPPLPPLQFFILLQRTLHEHQYFFNISTFCRNFSQTHVFFQNVSNRDWYWCTIDVRVGPSSDAHIQHSLIVPTNRTMRMLFYFHCTSYSRPVNEYTLSVRLGYMSLPLPLCCDRDTTGLFEQEFSCFRITNRKGMLDIL